MGAYASSTTIISGGAVKKAAEKVRAQVLELAVEDAGRARGQPGLRQQRSLHHCASAASRVSMADVALHAMYKEKLQIMDGASHFNTDSPPPFCATFAEVEVDTETGQVRVLHLATAVDPRRRHQSHAGRRAGGRRGGARAGLRAHRGAAAR